MNKEKCIPQNQSETIEYLDDSAIKLDAHRLEGLQELQNTQKIKDQIALRENERLKAKHGENHPEVIATQSRIEYNQKMMPALEVEIEKSSVSTAPVDNSSWKVQGKVYDSNGNALKGFIVSFYGDKKTKIDAFGESITDDLGNYSLTANAEILGRIDANQPLYLSISNANKKNVYLASDPIFMSKAPVIYQDIYIKSETSTQPPPPTTTSPPPRQTDDKEVYSVSGKIATLKGEGLGGLTIRVFDSDPVSSDDPLGEAVTDDKGFYEILFQKKDFEMLGMELTGPDLYIRAYSKEKMVGESKVFKNSGRYTTIDLKIS